MSWTHDDERDVGYWIGREHWGKGIATAALGALLAELQDRPLFAHVVEHNIGSIRVLEKCGFSNVGSVVLPNEEGRRREGGVPLPARGSSGLGDDRVARPMAEPADRPGGAPLHCPLHVAQPDQSDP